MYTNLILNYSWVLLNIGFFSREYEQKPKTTDLKFTHLT